MNFDYRILLIILVLVALFYYKKEQFKTFDVAVMHPAAL
jgi:hypothetical protein